MRRIRRILPVLIALGIGFVVLAPSGAGAQTSDVTCVAPNATDIRTPTGAIDIDGYQAAVAAFNVCVAGESVTKPVAASTTLAFTGSNSTDFAVIAVAVIGLGAGAVFLSRRRRVS
jgi:LPXTG-motif cell wall-anchored protein